MKIESEKHRMDVHNGDLAVSKFKDMSGCSFDDLDILGWRVHNVNLGGLRVDKANLAGAFIVNARLDGATIDGIAVNDLLASWRAGLGTKSA